MFQIEEAERRQKILLDIMKKELAHNHRMVIWGLLRHKHPKSS